jgi:hypothetical protein
MSRPLAPKSPQSRRQQARANRGHRRQELMTRSQRAVRWLQPGLVVKRWVLTSGLGLLTGLNRWSRLGRSQTDLLDS